MYLCKKLQVVGGGCACTVELYLAMYSRTEESYMGNAHEFSAVHQGTGSACNAHGESSRGWVLPDSHLIFLSALAKKFNALVQPHLPRQDKNPSPS